MKPLEPLVKALSKLPGIGEKSATRLALFILRDTKGLTRELIQSLQYIENDVHFCESCQNLTEGTLCSICQDNHRDRSLVCVVQEPVDLMMIEKTGDFKGLYHVLHGVLSPLDGIGPEELRLKSLIQRLENEPIQEIIIATNPNSEGEATALYLKDLFSTYPIKVTRIASGVPIGGILEYTDAKTLARALSHRQSF